MCGISGFSNLKCKDNKALIKKMISIINHRGPDDDGFTSFRNTFIGIKRLAIIDVNNGSQPFKRNNLSIVYNGEIYNYKEINNLLADNGIRLKTHSDTETVLASYELWGEKCLNYFRGMFAFAILNHNDGSLFIARDRLGVKPLYYYSFHNQFIFASEIKSILEYSEIQNQINSKSIFNYLKFRYVPGPDTLFKNIKKFPSAHYLKFNKGEFKFYKYWDHRSIKKSNLSFNDAQGKFNELFDESTKLRLMSERPMGAFLSGGLDSTAIVTSMQKNNESNINTYSIGFDWQGDESAIAQQTAARLNCNHHQIYCKKNDTKFLPKIIWHLDEPIGDGIILPMYLLSLNASKDVSVILSGEGADEVLGGYFTHKIINYALMYQSLCPNVLKDKLVKPLVKLLPESFLNNFFDYPANLGDEGKKRLYSLLNISQNGDIAKIYQFVISLFEDNEIKKLISKYKYSEYKLFDKENNDLNSMLNMQFDTWLPDDILCKQDKLQMANSIEGRVPFMDHKIVEFLLSLPYSFKGNLFNNKLLLRNYLKTNNQLEISKKRKIPFYIPIDNYLNSRPLKMMTDELLSESSVKKRDLFNWDYIKQIKEIKNYNFLHGKKLFSIAMLELWFRIFVDKEKGWI